MTIYATAYAGSNNLTYFGYSAGASNSAITTVSQIEDMVADQFGDVRICGANGLQGTGGTGMPIVRTFSIPAVLGQPVASFYGDPGNSATISASPTNQVYLRVGAGTVDGATVKTSFQIVLEYDVEFYGRFIEPFSLREGKRLAKLQSIPVELKEVKDKGYSPISDTKSVYPTSTSATQGERLASSDEDLNPSYPLDLRRPVLRRR